MTRESGQGKLHKRDFCSSLSQGQGTGDLLLSYSQLLNFCDSAPRQLCTAIIHCGREMLVRQSVRAWLLTFPEEVERPTCGKQGILRQRVPVRGLGSWKSESRPSAGFSFVLCPSPFPPCPS